MEIKCICIQCGLPKSKNRFFYHKNKGWSYRCKRCEIKNKAIGRERSIIRSQKDIQQIKKEINNDPSYIENGILYLAEIITTNILKQRNLKL